MKITEVDYIVIGSGIAGLTAANILGQHKKVVVLTKGAIKESSTQYAQGGIAAALQHEDTPDLHLEDTLSAGDGLCNRKAVEVLVKEGIPRVQELIQLGANFDKQGNEFSFTKEGAHQKRRILHAGDKTGREIEKTLGNRLKKNKNIIFYPNTMVLELILQENKCIGCVIKDKSGISIMQSKAVLLATGGLGQVFLRNTNPPVTTGDGIALAFKAGCDVVDMEFVQFHPTTLLEGDKKPISLFLISEAVRGEGAKLLNINGKQFMSKYHPLGELAPRDIVARAIYDELKETKSSCVYLDLSDINIDLQKRFPTIYKRCLESKIDIRKDFIPVSPAVHYCMGGIKTDYKGQTNINSLYAAGEVACLGIHGANRLASNSLLDGLVFGYRAGKAALEKNSSNADDAIETINIETLKKLKIKYKTNNIKTDKFILKNIKQKIRKVMWDNVSIIRTQNTLIETLNALLQLKKDLEKCERNEQCIEVENMLIVSELITEFSLERKESRGCHFRSDYNQKESFYKFKHIVKNKEDKKCKIIAQSELFSQKGVLVN